MYFYNNYFDATKILFLSKIIDFRAFESLILCILKSLKSLNLLNKSFVNCGVVSVGAGVIIKTFNFYFIFNNLEIMPPTI